MERIENVELDDLVRELNAPGSEESATVGGQPRPAVSSMTPSEQRLGQRFEAHPHLQALLRRSIALNATDVHLIAGELPRLRIDGDLQRVDDTETPERLDEAAMESWFVEPLGSARKAQLKATGAVDLSLQLRPGLEQDDPARPIGGDGFEPVRFRVHLHRLGGGVAASLRRLPGAIPDLSELRLPSSLGEILRPMQGLVLVCGPTGSGKSTTLAAMVRWINERRPVHVVTLEDPVEYRHPHRKALIRQLEVGVDTPSFAHGLRAALRQDPDVILLGEMRDLESIEAALQAAETGHLVLSTVHTSDSAQAVQRIVDVFPEGSREQSRQLLAGGLNSVVCQRLLPRISGGVVPAVEVLRATHPVRHHIRSGAVHKIYNELVLGKRQGMVTLEQSLAELVARQEVRLEDALVRSTRPEELESLL